MSENQELDDLVKDIYRRVANEILNISNLILNKFEDVKEEEKLVKNLPKVASRIHSLYLIHQKLLDSHQLGSVDLKTFTQSLTDKLFRDYGVSKDDVKLKIAMEEVRLIKDSAVVFGAIYNELLSNSLKHAFPKKEGEVRFSYLLNGHNGIEITMGDSGPGIPENLDYRGTQSLGLPLVLSLVEDRLKGRFEYNKGENKFKIEFGAKAFKGMGGAVH